MHHFDFLKKFEFTPLNILKLCGAALAALVVLALAYALLLRPAVEFFSMTGYRTSGITQGAAPDYGYDGDFAYAKGGAYGYTDDALVAEESLVLSARNVAVGIPSPEPPRPGTGTVGSDAEEYEVTEYNATIETRDAEEPCASVASLKELDYVIFENASEHERGCSYTFKVAHAHVAEILLALEALDPRNLSESTHTIKPVLDDFTSEEEILKNELASVDETLEKALSAYDEITTLATRSGDATALAKIFDSRINLIERLTAERIDVAAQLERLGRSKAEQLDRLDYTYFYVRVFENKFFDAKDIADSWKRSVQATIHEINAVLQEVTLGLIALAFLVAQWILYGFILLLVVKYGWRVTKYIWKK